jgi:MoaA/NifB/PqqE/SkfB family radical SAM enzyme
MYDITEIRDIHLEITNKCQARCPMCARRTQGGPINPNMVLDEINLETFKKWFNESFISQLWNLYMCGNLGDPVVAQDTLEIFKYIRSINSTMTLSMHTNGSARDLKWWKELAKLNVTVIFGIDGLEDTHKLYRVDTDWSKIIKNAQAFIEAGGLAEWHMLVFEHNEHQIEQCKELSTEIGFKNFVYKHTARMVNGECNALTVDGTVTHILRPASTNKNVSAPVSNLPPSTISCKAIKYKQIYISANGNVSPCCWLAMTHKSSTQDRKLDYIDKIGMYPTLKEQSLLEIFESNYFNKIDNTLDNNPLKECSRQCGVVDRLASQFNL